MKPLLRILLIPVILFLCAIEVFPQNQDYSFFTYNKQNGLPDNTIYYIFQDNQGFLWLCSGSGLVRYDGYTFKLYAKSNNPENSGINSDRPVHVMQDNKGLIWISTSDQGIFVYNPIYDSFGQYSHIAGNPNSLASNDVHRIFQDSKNRIWICTLGGGLDLFQPSNSSFFHFVHHEGDSLSLPDNNVTSIIEDNTGQLWVAPRGKYICSFDPGTGIFRKFRSSFSSGRNMDSYFKHLYITEPSSLWIATYGSGLYKFNTHDHQFKCFYNGYHANELSSNNIESLIPEDKDKLMIVTDGGGLNILDENTGNIYQKKYDYNAINGLSTDALYAILKDRSNNIWIGTFRAGLLKIKENTKAFEIITQNPDNKGLSYKSVLCILRDKDGNTWYGTDGGGLDCYNPKTRKYTYYKFDPSDNTSISDNVVKVLYEDKQGVIWAGTFFGGLNKFDKVTKRFIRYQIYQESNSKLSSINTWSIFEDSKNLFWVGNFSAGIDILDRKNGQTKNFQPVPGDSTSLSHTQVSSIVEDTNGNLWMGTLHGLNLFNRRTYKFTRFYHKADDPQSLSDDKITCLFYDSKKRLWVGTDDGGINCMTKPGIFKVYDKTKGMPDNSVQSIEEDDNGNLWISTRNGLVKFNAAKEEFYNFDDFEGLISKEFNWNSSFYDTKNNLMYFGSIDGVVVFNPDKINFSKPFPKVVITDLEVFNTSVKVRQKYHGKILLDKSTIYGGKAILTPRENAFSIEFSSLEFNFPTKIKYRYRLKDFDKDWVYANSDQRVATYTNLPGGNYTFEITSTNSDGIWNNKITTFEITIVPHFYNTLWFKALTVLLIALIIYIIFKLRIERQKKRIREQALQRESDLIQKRNNELKGELASNTMLLLQKNESMHVIKTQLEELLAANQPDKKVKELVTLLEREMEVDVYWEQFQYNFDQVYNNMLTKLNDTYPELSKTNLKLCAYLRMNLTSKEISSLMNITTSGIDKARNRLRKKLNLKPSDDLYEFLLSL